MVDEELEPQEPEIDVEELDKLSADERRKRQTGLTDDIARRYDPTRLASLVVDYAGKGEQLEYGLKSDMEKRLGGSFDHVRIIRGQFAEDVTRAHRADAITVANTGMILVREGPRADPNTALGRALVAHELTHVTQAQRGLHFALEGGEGGSGEHEAQAEAVEAAVASEGGGGEGGGEGGGGGGGGGAPAAGGAKGGALGLDLGPMIMARVFELIAERRRLMRNRLGGEE
jgi:hypothetical protein